MNCTKFLSLIDDFIYDKIEYSDDLEEFIEHAKTCNNCREELELYYTIHRGLGDIDSPSDNDDGNFANELESIITFYEEIFEKQLFMKKAGKISIIVLTILIVYYIFFFRLLYIKIWREICIYLKEFKGLKLRL